VAVVSWVLQSPWASNQKTARRAGVRPLRVPTAELQFPLRTTVYPTLEACSKPGLEQVLRSGTAAPLTPSRVVGNEEELNIHAGL
jgi:hypothetical protein